MKTLFFGTTRLFIAVLCSLAYAGQPEEQIPDKLYHPRIDDQAIWVSSTFLMQQAKAGDLDDHALGFLDELSRTNLLKVMTKKIGKNKILPSGNCLEYTTVIASPYGKTYRSAEDLMEAPLIGQAVIRGIETGFLHGYPIRLLSVEMIQPLSTSEEVDSRLIYLAYPNAVIEIGDHVFCSGQNYPYVPQIGQRIVVFLDKSIDRDKNL